jgi:hypothetical protein
MQDRRRRMLIYSLISVVSLAIGVEFALTIVRTDDATPMVSTRVEYVRNLPTHRCLDLHPGDGVVIHADRRAIVRLYRDDELVAECRLGIASAHCRNDDGRLQLEWTFERAAKYGDYRWLTFRAVPSPSQGSFLADLSAARERRVAVEYGAIPFSQ